jgi:hypothetical protein
MVTVTKYAVYHNGTQEWSISGIETAKDREGYTDYTPTINKFSSIEEAISHMDGPEDTIFPVIEIVKE